MGVLSFTNGHKYAVDSGVLGKRYIAVPQHRRSAQYAILLGDFTARAAAGACGDYQGDYAGAGCHARALATAPLPAKPKRGNGLPKF
jgi:hypothetical protein